MAGVLRRRSALRRAGSLFERVASFQNLLDASRKARRGKRWKPYVRDFEFDLEKELIRIEEELRSGAYTPGRYTEFYVLRPKKRLISAAPYRDRVVHHALINVLEPIFDRRMIHDSYACRPVKGSHRAVVRCSEFARSAEFVLRFDVKKFFPTIDHQILKATLASVIKDETVLALAGRIIDGSNPQEEVGDFFPGDDLFTSQHRRKGLPIGNLTSQWFANFFLNGFDHFVKRDLGIRMYIRYMDDMLAFSDSKAALLGWKDRFHGFLAGVRLRPKESKCLVQRTRDGIPFLGFKVFPGFRLLLYYNKVTHRKRMKRMALAFREGSLVPADITQAMNSWIAHASWADTWRLRERMFSEIIFSKGAGRQRVAPLSRR